MNDTKEHILDVSFSLFLQKSFKEVTMQEIVERSGMSKGAFYHYFESKEQLFLEVINHFFSVLRIDYSKLGKESLAQFYHDYIKSLKDTIESFLQKRADAGGFVLNYYVLAFDAVKLFPSVRARMVEALADEVKAWEEVVRIARNNGEIKSPMTDEQIAHLFVYTSDGAGMSCIVNGNIALIADTLLAVWDGLYRELST